VRPGDRLLRRGQLRVRHRARRVHPARCALKTYSDMPLQRGVDEARDVRRGAALASYVIM
jgi:hypothetical protein